jgi:16S rRNA C967 or C1407 C5-methylase (RsmB/RsmF family)
MADKKQKGAEEDVFYVGVNEPVEIRRNVLEASKDIIQYLQRFERFKQVRAEKQEEIQKLKEMTHEIRVMVRKLKTALPKTKLRAILHKHEEEIMMSTEKETKPAKKKSVKKAVEAIPQERVSERKVTELEKLESELGEIESRLTRLA